MDYWLPNYDLTPKEICCYAFLISPYALLHWQTADKDPRKRWGHRIIALIQFIPILGVIAAGIERLCVLIFKNEPAKSNELPIVKPILEQWQVDFKENLKNLKKFTPITCEEITNQVFDHAPVVLHAYWQHKILTSQTNFKVAQLPGLIFKLEHVAVRNAKLSHFVFPESVQFVELENQPVKVWVEEELSLEKNQAQLWEYLVSEKELQPFLNAILEEWSLLCQTGIWGEASFVSNSSSLTLAQVKQQLPEESLKILRERFKSELVSSL